MKALKITLFGLTALLPIVGGTQIFPWRLPYVLGSQAEELASDFVTTDAPYPYKSFDGTTYTLTPWVGRHVALLTRADSLDKGVMTKLLSGLDSAYEYYWQLTGRTPDPLFQYKGHLSIAQVPKTCGAGCGYLGQTGVELLDSTFETLYEQVRSSSSFDQAVFYEFGRNFWFYSPQLGKVAPFITGFAILNRFLSMEAAGLKGAPFKPGMSFSDFKKSILIDLINIYINDTKWTWQNTLAIGVAPPNPNNWGDADLAAAILNEIQRDGGPSAMRAFWKTLETLPPATTQVDTMTNFLRAAKAATGKDYRGLLRDASLPVP